MKIKSLFIFLFILGLVACSERLIEDMEHTLEDVEKIEQDVEGRAE